MQKATYPLNAEGEVQRQQVLADCRTPKGALFYSTEILQGRVPSMGRISLEIHREVIMACRETFVKDFGTSPIVLKTIATMTAYIEYVDSVFELAKMAEDNKKARGL